MGRFKQGNIIRKATGSGGGKGSGASCKKGQKKKRK